MKLESYFFLFIIHNLTHALIPLSIFPRVYQNLKTEPSSCSLIIQNIITHHSAILLQGYKGYPEVPATNIKPLHCKVNDVSSLIRTVFHSHYPDLSDPRPPIRRSSLRKPNIEIKN